MIHYRGDDYVEGRDYVICERIPDASPPEDHGKFLDRPLRIVGLIVMCLLSALIGALAWAAWEWTR